MWLGEQVLHSNHASVETELGWQPHHVDGVLLRDSQGHHVASSGGLDLWVVQGLG
jgi:hypothetical protein